MREHRVTLSQLTLMGSADGLLSFGVGLLVGGWLSTSHRRALGTALLVTGALSAIPVAFMMLKKPKPATPQPSARPKVNNAAARLIH